MWTCRWLTHCVLSGSVSALDDRATDITSHPGQTAKHGHVLCALEEVMLFIVDHVKRVAWSLDLR